MLEAQGDPKLHPVAAKRIKDMWSFVEMLDRWHAQMLTVPKPKLAALCRAMEKAFSSHFQANVYLSPPNAQGFGTHFDSHDVFVLQVAGSKIWTLSSSFMAAISAFRCAIWASSS